MEPMTLILKSHYLKQDPLGDIRDIEEFYFRVL